MIKKLMNMKYKEKSLVIKYLSKFYNIVNQLATIKMMLDNGLQALLLLNSLLDSWKIVVEFLSYLTSNSVMLLKMIKDCMLNKEIIRRA